MIRTVLSLLVAALVFTSGGGVATAASPAIGDRAPDFVGKEFVGGEACSLASLRGQVVFLEIFRTWCGPCNDQAKHLSALHEKFGANGLRVLGVTTEAKSAVEAFIAKHSCTYTIAVESSDSGAAYGTTGVPSPWLIGADGRVLHKGIPSESQIEEALKSVRLPPTLTKPLESFAAPIKKGRLGEVRTKVGRLLEGTTLSEDDRKAADDLASYLDWRAQNAFADAKADGEVGRWYEATVTLEQVGVAFKGTPVAKDASDQVKAILADKVKRDAVTAGKRLEAAIDRIRDKKLDPEEATALLKPIASKYAETVAGKRAAGMIEELAIQPKK